ncbi:MAG: TetR/AcrR family transcriptional regulator [Solirubrobacteraceae bacterium]|nr:TetR/AcrR family transcriptional regulator [Solirubrobacteraceae bacterium]
MPTPRTRMSTEARREQLLRVAAELFGSRSFDDIWVDEVAQAAGVSRALVYHYFPTKRELFHEVVRLHVDELAQATLPDPSIPPRDRLRASIDGYLAYVDAHADGYRSIHQGAYSWDAEILELIEGRFAVQAGNIREGLREIVGDLADAPVVALAARAWVGFLVTATLSWLEDRTIARDELRDLVVDTLAGAIRAAIEGMDDA